jgi:hypothetical protein
MNDIMSLMNKKECKKALRELYDSYNAKTEKQKLEALRRVLGNMCYTGMKNERIAHEYVYLSENGFDV